MALIKCPECNREISDKAKACPNCGCPLNDYNVDYHEQPVVSVQPQEGKKQNMTIWYIGTIISWFVLSVLLCTIFVDHNSSDHLYNAKDEILLCSFSAVIMIIIAARKFIDKFLLSLIVLIVSVVCSEYVEHLHQGATIIVYLVDIVSIIIAVLKRKNPTRIKLLEGLRGKTSLVLLNLCGIIGCYAMMGLIGIGINISKGFTRYTTESIIIASLLIALSLILFFIAFWIGRKSKSNYPTPNSNGLA